eukprot:c20235_g1_i1.p1 GENE.c20235_g1_i1~~c20235_g1_i1.p1  ORF type:complete len:333 (+),score=45.53 c20235_g1_i1:57-1055(+)
MTEINNLFLRKPNGKSATLHFDKTPSMTEFRKALIDKNMGTDAELSAWTFSYFGKPFDLNDEKKFDESAKTFKSNSTIHGMLRLNGGSLTITKQQSESIIGDVLASAVHVMPVVKKDCIICFEEEDCIKVCCHYICPLQFISNFQANGFRYKCYTCDAFVDNNAIFENSIVEMSVQAHKDLMELLKHVDVQVCQCGVLHVNETLYSKQACSECKLEFCFFCNETWDKKMVNKKYSCGQNCTYDGIFDYTLEPFAYDESIKIPSSRICPGCFHLGGYDSKCKYHTCPNCSLEFCFFCLKSKQECAKAYGKSYKEVCVEPVKQTMALFPRFLSP